MGGMSPEIWSAQAAVRTAKKDQKAGISKMLEKSHGEQLKAFEKMFLAQVQHQNPLNPMDNNEFTHSIMMFHSTAQQSKMNDHLEQINLNHIKAQSMAAKGYLNKLVEYEGSEFTYEGDNQEFQFHLPDHVHQAELAIVDPSGNLVTAYPLAIEPGQAGQKKWVWDGSLYDHPEEYVGPGQYHAKVVAQTKEGQAIEVPLTLNGVVRKIGYHQDAGEFALLVKNTPIEFSDLKSAHKMPSSELITMTQSLQEQMRKYDELQGYLQQRLDPSAALNPSSEPLTTT